MTAKLTEGPRFRLRLDGTRDSYPMVIGAFDIDADGKDELFVKVLDFLFHSGGSSMVRLVQMDHDGLAVVTDENGRPFDIRVGGITQLGEGADCRDVNGDERLEIRLLRITTRDHTLRRWRATQRIYGWSRGSLALIARRNKVVVARSYTDPAVRRYYQLRCGSFDPPYPY